jgi:hypothetical protein
MEARSIEISVERIARNSEIKIASIAVNIKGVEALFYKFLRF